MLINFFNIGPCPIKQTLFPFAIFLILPNFHGSKESVVISVSPDLPILKYVGCLENFV